MWLSQRFKAPNVTNSDSRLTHCNMYQYQVESGTALGAWSLLVGSHSDLQGWEMISRWIYVDRTCCLDGNKATFVDCEVDSVCWTLQPVFLLAPGGDRGNWLPKSWEEHSRNSCIRVQEEHRTSAVLPLGSPTSQIQDSNNNNNRNACLHCINFYIPYITFCLHCIILFLHSP